MKKLITILAIVLFATSSARIIEVADAGITDKLKAVIAAKNAPAGTAYLFSEDFTTSNTEDVASNTDFDSEADTGGLLSVTSNEMHRDHTATTIAQVLKDMGSTDYTDVYFYFTFEIDDEGSLGASKYANLLIAYSNDNTQQLYVRLIADVESNIRGFKLYTLGGADPQYYFDGAVNTEYPIKIHYKVGNPGAAELWVYTGGDWQAGAGNSTTEDLSGYTGVDHFNFGGDTNIADTTLNFKFDTFIFDDSDMGTP